MKLPSLFIKTPKYKKFNFTPRFYNPEEEERRERELRIEKELQAQSVNQADDSIAEKAYGHRERIAGSFKQNKKTVTVQSDPATGLMRLLIMFILAVGLIAFLQWGKTALVFTACLFIPLYFFMKIRSIRK